MIDYSKYTIPQLKSELRLFGLPRTGKKSVLVARVTKFLEDASFTSFPKLPLELRLKVWGYALPRRRVIELSLGPPPWNSLGTTTPCLTTAVNIMLSNKEALGIVAARYRPNQVPYSHFDESSTTSSQQWPIIYKDPNFHDDVFHISDLVRSIDPLKEFYNSLPHIKAVAINLDDLEECFTEGGIDALLEFTTLSELILVEDYRSPPKQSNRPKSFATQLFESMNPPTLDPPSWLTEYSQSPTHPQSQFLADYFKRTVAKHPELKKLEKITIYFTQVY